MELEKKVDKSKPNRFKILIKSRIGTSGRVSYDPPAAKWRWTSSHRWLGWAAQRPGPPMRSHPDPWKWAAPTRSPRRRSVTWSNSLSRYLGTERCGHRAPEPLDLAGSPGSPRLTLNTRHPSSPVRCGSCWRRTTAVWTSILQRRPPASSWIWRFRSIQGAGRGGGVSDRRWRYTSCCLGRRVGTVPCRRSARRGRQAWRRSYNWLCCHLLLICSWGCWAGPGWSWRCKHWCSECWVVGFWAGEGVGTQCGGKPAGVGRGPVGGCGRWREGWWCPNHAPCLTTCLWSAAQTHRPLRGAAYPRLTTLHHIWNVLPIPSEFKTKN